MQKPRIFFCLDDDVMIYLIAKAKKRIVYAAPSMSENVAHAIGAQTTLYPQLKLDVILDVDAQSLRLGYGQMGALKYLMGQSLTIRCCPGLKIGVLAVDHRSFVFAPTAKIIEDPEYGPPNAINIDSKMTEWLLHAMVPQDMLVERAKREISCVGTSNDPDPDPDQPGDPPYHEAKFDDEIIETGPVTDCEDSSVETNTNLTEPEIGHEAFQPVELKELVEDIEKRPPREFDHEREVLVYNGYLRFVDIKFTGGRLSARIVQLPENILSIAGDRPEMVEVKATCKLFEGVSVLPEVDDFERRVDEVRRCYTQSLGNDLGRVVLIKDEAAFGKEIQDLTDELDEIRKVSIEKIDLALKGRKKRLKKILYPLLFKNPNSDLRDWPGRKLYPKHETVGRYLTRELDKVFPKAEAMIGRMDLVCIYKDVTWEMLNQKKFGEAIRRIFPHEAFTKLYGERNTIGERTPKPPREPAVVEDEWPSEIG